jgi:hypothetical protein
MTGTDTAADHVALAVRRAGWWTGDPTSDEIAAELLGALKAAGYTVIDTEVLRTALNFGYGKEPTPEGAIARANLREQITT